MALRRTPRIRRKRRLGVGYRIAVFTLWPLMMMLTKRDWKGFDRFEGVDDGIIVVSNHISWFDPLVVALALWEHDRPPRFLAKEEVFRVPLLGAILRSAGQIRVYRETDNAIDAVRDGIEAVQKGETLAVYPEGTLTRDPDSWPMSGKTGAARIALATGRPVFPMANWGAMDVMRPYRKELRLLPRKTMHVRLGPPIDLTDLQGRDMDHEILEEATNRILNALTDQVSEMRGTPPPPVRFQYQRERRPATNPGEAEA